MKSYPFILNKILLPLGGFFIGKDYLKSLSLWKKYDRLSEEELTTLEQTNLKKTLLYSIHNVPFYSHLKYNDALSPTENLKLFPVLTKDLLRSERENLVSKKFNVEDLQKNYSSGSSGVQSYSYSTKKNKFLLQGIQGHWYQWCGYSIGDGVLQFGISPNRVFPKNIKDFFFRVYYQNAFSLSNKDYESIITALKKGKIKYIIGYPSAINEFSNYLIANELSFKIDGVISLGDKLFPHYEKNFNRCFQFPKIIDTYGCAEGLMMACRDDLPYYYIMSPHVFIEIVDSEDNAVPDGTLGHVLVTCFTNMAQPFIRYKLGDLAIKLPKESYPEKRNYFYPLLEKIVGRETDVVITPTEKTLIVHSFTGIFEYFPEIKQYRIIQNTIDTIIVEYITDAHFCFDESVLLKIKDKINQITDNSLTISFNNVNKISPTKSGKPQIIQSTLKV